jgi:hypothetical protein
MMGQFLFTLSFLRASNPWDITWLPLGVQRGKCVHSLAQLITMKIAQNEQKKPKNKGGWFENSVWFGG